MKASPQFKEAVRQELKRQIEALGKDKQRIFDDIKSGRQGLVDATRKIGYAWASLSSLAKKNNDPALNAMAKKLRQAADNLNEIDGIVESVQVAIGRQR